MRNDFKSNYLQHWGLKKGEKRKNHKYFERVEKNGKYLYFYTQAEYEAWLNKGNKALDTAKNKVKAAAKKPATKITKSSLLNAINNGRQMMTNTIAKAQKTLTKSNAKATIDRGNKTISSIINKTSKQVQNTASNVQKSSKAVSANIQKKAKSIVSNVTKTLKAAGKDTAKSVKQYQAKGEKAIKSALNKAGNVSLSKTTKQYSQKGNGVIESILISVAAAVVIAAVKAVAPVVAKKVKEIADKIFNPEVTVTTSHEFTDQRKKEVPPKDFCSDSKDSYKEDRAAHSDVPQKDKPTTRDEDMEAVNPNFMSEEDRKRQEDIIELFYIASMRGDEAECEKLYDEYMAIEDKYAGYMNNCANCTLTYDLRRRGYDVEAPWNPNGTYMDSLYAWYELTDDDFVGYGKGEGNAISRKEAKQLKEALEKEYPDGAYGHLNLEWAEGGGHDCVWSIEDGEAIIRDCQTNQVVNFETYATKSSEMIFVRTDDKKLKDQAYEVATAEKANSYGKKDTDEYQDTDEVRDYDLYEENGKELVKTKQDVDYDKYWRKAAGKKR